MFIICKHESRPFGQRGASNPGNFWATAKIDLRGKFVTWDDNALCRLSGYTASVGQGSETN